MKQDWQTVSISLQFPAASPVAIEKIHPSKKYLKNCRAFKTLLDLKVKKISLQLELIVSLLSPYLKHKTIQNWQGQKKGNFCLFFKFWQSAYDNLTFKEKACEMSLLLSLM